MSKERRRSISTAQVKMREMDIFVDGTVTTPVAAGFDEFGIKSVTDTGTGDYLITLNAAFGRDDIMAFAQSTTTGVLCEIGAVTRNSVQVLCFDVATGATPTDGAFFLRILGSEFNYNI